MGGDAEGAPEDLLLRVPASLLPGYVGGGDRSCRVSSHSQDLGHVLPSL